MQRFAPAVSLFLHVDIEKMSSSEACRYIAQLFALSDGGLLPNGIKFNNTGL